MNLFSIWLLFSLYNQKIYEDTMSEPFSKINSMSPNKNPMSVCDPKWNQTELSSQRHNKYIMKYSFTENQQKNFKEMTKNVTKKHQISPELKSYITKFYPEIINCYSKVEKISLGDILCLVKAFEIQEMREIHKNILAIYCSTKFCQFMFFFIKICLC